MKFRRAPVRYVCCLLLICGGTLGVLFSPSVGLFGGTEMRSFTLNQVRDYPWGTAIASSELVLPFVKDQRGLVVMNVFIAGSLSALFGGVHWFTALRKRSTPHN